MAGEYVEFHNNSQPALNETNVNLMQQLIKQDIQGAVSGDTLPVGAILPFGSNTIPENWLLCDGSAVSRTDYQQLFNTIGITFGQGDGFTTFNLPDLRDRVPIGKDSNDTDFDVLGKTAGERKHTLTIAEMPEHDHNVEKSTNIDRLVLMAKAQNLYGTSGNGTGSGEWEWNYGVPAQGGGQAHNVTQPSIATNYIIKATQSAGVVAMVIDNLTSTSVTNALSANQGKVLNDRMNFSTTEHIIGKWIDGKDIYEKVIVGPAVASNSSEYVNLNVNDLDKLINTEGFGISSNGNWFPLSRAHPNSFNYQSSFYYSEPNTRFEIETGTQISFSETYIIARYTKSTT